MFTTILGAVKLWRKEIAIFLVVMSMYTVWYLDRQAQFREGKQVATQELTAKLQTEREIHERHIQQINANANARIRNMQAQVERERHETQRSIGRMRSELDSLRGYAQRQIYTIENPDGTSTTVRLDGKTAARGWQLFQQCATRYARVAEIADRQRDDLAEWKGYGSAIQQYNAEISKLNRENETK